jgi:DNA-binding response OmpR family regulator
MPPATRADRDGSPAADAPLILIAGDDPHTARMVGSQFLRAGFRVQSTTEGNDALRVVRSMWPDLLVLDPTAAGSSAPRIIRALRRVSAMPIILLTANGSDAERIRGLQSGADDCVSKPFNPLELVARAQSILRRTTGTSRGRRGERLQVRGLLIDLERWAATLNGTAMQLRPREFDLLRTLVSHVGVALHRDRLLDLVWGPEYDGDRRTVDVHVAALREKLAGSDVRIETVRNIGYRLE